VVLGEGWWGGVVGGAPELDLSRKN
jgi:hypothetical protein